MTHFADAAKRAGVRRIIYLGGLGDDSDPNPFPHLQSRHEVGGILRGSGVETVEFRAGMVVGAGSRSYRLLKSLTERLPVMIFPRWLTTAIQPLTLDDVLAYLLDAGCGTGENARYFARRSQKVTGIDFLAEPIRFAQQKASERGLTATILVMDALALKELPELFDSVIDSGLFHVFGDEDRRRYVEGLASVLKPGGRLFLLCFSDTEPGDQGPRRVSQREIGEFFADGWVVESIEPTRFEVRPDPDDISFSERGPRAWFVVVRRAGGTKSSPSR